MFEQIRLLFENIDAATALVLIAGLVFITLEIFQTGSIVFGVTGGILYLTGMIFRVLHPKDNEQPLAMLFIMTLFLMIYTVMIFLFMVRTTRKGWLTRTPKTQSVEKPEKVGGKDDYSHLINNLGVAVTKLSPDGSAEIKDKIYEVTAEGFFINRGEVIRVISIEGKHIVVKKAE